MLAASPLLLVILSVAKNLIGSRQAPQSNSKLDMVKQVWKSAKNGMIIEKGGHKNVSKSGHNWYRLYSI